MPTARKGAGATDQDVAPHSTEAELAVMESAT
jgi:hypothetical protein